MGVKGLLPCLKSIERPLLISEFRGKTLAIDAYAWLHRGAVCCSQELALNQPTSRYLQLTLKRVAMLESYGVTPYFVFDGNYVPSKRNTEETRHRLREASKAEALRLYDQGDVLHSLELFKKCVDITPYMAKQVIEILKERKIKFVVAPYEADAQMVYLEKTGLVDGIVSEDSDLLVYGAQCLLTKMDDFGHCIEIRRDRLWLAKEIPFDGLSDHQFRTLAIFSGCDYSKGIFGLGPKRAIKYIRAYGKSSDVIKAIRREGKYHVDPGFDLEFEQAEITFLHQPVFCPTTGKVVLLNDAGDRADTEIRAYIGDAIPADIASLVASGELDPITKKPFKDLDRGRPTTPVETPRLNISITNFFSLAKRPFDDSNTKLRAGKSFSEPSYKAGLTMNTRAKRGFFESDDETPTKGSGFCGSKFFKKNFENDNDEDKENVYQEKQWKRISFNGSLDKFMHGKI